jgi:hypothetical protein
MKKEGPFLLILLLILVLTSCSETNTCSNATSLMEAAKLANVTKIVFYDGRGGLNQPLTVENKDKINEFLGYLKDCIVQKQNSSDPKTGWNHEAVFYKGSKQTADITFTNPVIINKKDYYNVVKNAINKEKIDTFLQSVDTSWKKK